METFIIDHWLDITTTILGLAYILFEYKASVWLWPIGFVMQALGIVLYYEKGLYADCGMEFYYICMTCYGYYNWTRGHSAKTSDGSGCTSDGSGKAIDGRGKAIDGRGETANDSGKADRSEAGAGNNGAERPITHFERWLILPWTLATAAVWAAIYYLLAYHTDSHVPVADSFTTALSIVGIWALARKYLEQWLIWIVVDAVTCGLYFYKDIPFKASLYGLYIIIAIAGYFRWRKIMHTAPADGTKPSAESKK